MNAMEHLLPKNLDELSSDALRALIQQQAAVLAHHEQLAVQQKQALAHKDEAIKTLELMNSKLKHELAVIRRYRFGQKSEQYSGAQGLLFEEDAQADLVAIENELDALNKTADSKAKTSTQPKRRALPPELPRIEIYHEPEELQCNCGCALKRIGEDVTEKLDYIPGKAQVERHIRGKWVCKECETLTQSPMPAHVIDKGLASHRLLAHVLVAKYADHLPLYRQQQRFAREGVTLPLSTLADWQGKLVTDDYSGYKQSFRQGGITEIACMAHARRKFYELQVPNKSEIAAQALASFKALDYSLKRWTALTRYLEDGCVPIDNNHIEQQIRPLALGRKNWLFAGSLRAGQRAAAVMTLIQSAKLNGHDPLAYLGDILQRLPTQPNHRIHELLPHHWQPAEQ